VATPKMHNKDTKINYTKRQIFISRVLKMLESLDSKVSHHWVETSLPLYLPKGHQRIQILELYTVMLK
jgi:hypothetical protein